MKIPKLFKKAAAFVMAAVAGIMDNAVTAAITKAAAFLNNLGIFIVTSCNLD